MASSRRSRTVPWALASCLALGCSAQALGDPAAASGDDDRSNDSASECRKLEGGVQPALAVSAAYREIWRWPSASTYASQLVVDAEALYWLDVSGALWRLAKGASEAVQLHALPSGSWSTAGSLVVDDEELYWGEARQVEGNAAALSRLMHMPKAGGDALALLQAADHVLSPIAASAEHVFVNVDRSEGMTFARVNKQSGRLAMLESSPPTGTSRVVGDAFYWVEGPRSGSAAANLMRAKLPALEAELVHRIAGSVFDIGPGYVSWRQGVAEDERLPNQGQNFVVLNEASGCVRVLPGIGETISFRPALDATHAYWQRHVSGYSYPAGDPPPLPLSPLYRTNLLDGTTERLETPGLSLVMGSWIVGQDQEQVYVATDAALVAVMKP